MIQLLFRHAASIGPGSKRRKRDVASVGLGTTTGQFSGLCKASDYQKNKSLSCFDKSVQVSRNGSEACVAMQEWVPTYPFTRTTTRGRISLHHDLLDLLHAGLSTSDQRHHHVNLAFADGAVAVQVESLKLELPGNFGRGRVQHSFLEDGQSLRLPPLPPLGVQITILEVPSGRRRLLKHAVHPEQG